MDNEPKNRAEWFLTVEAYQRSNLTQVEFCKQNNLILAKFAYYLQAYRRKDNPQIPKVTPSFSKITLRGPSNSSGQDIKIELPNGFRCEISSSLSAEVIKRIVGALLSC